jgi:hypothetical protein
LDVAYQQWKIIQIKPRCQFLSFDHCHWFIVCKSEVLFASMEEVAYKECLGVLQRKQKGTINVDGIPTQNPGILIQGLDPDSERLHL